MVTWATMGSKTLVPSNPSFIKNDSGAEGSVADLESKRPRMGVGVGVEGAQPKVLTVHT